MLNFFKKKYQIIEFGNFFWIFKNILCGEMKISKINWLFDKHVLKLPRYYNMYLSFLYCIQILKGGKLSYTIYPK
jgi:hypothetical protein